MKKPTKSKASKAPKVHPPIKGEKLAKFYDLSAKLMFTWGEMFPASKVDPAEVMAAIEYKHGAQALKLFLSFYSDAYKKAPMWTDRESRIMALLLMAEVVKGHCLVWRWKK